jgi:prepilin-type N-terminal cleavage/methylation domain-containing protein
MRGFTLIEVLVVVAILGVILSFGMAVDLNVFKGDTFRAEQSTIVSVLSRARSRAMANVFDSNHGVCYDAGGDNYVIFKGGSCVVAGSELISANINISEHVDTVFPPVVFDRLTGNSVGGTIHIEDGIKEEDIIINNEGAINW